MADLEKKKGALALSLGRNAKEVRTSRALGILEDAERVFKRKVEDLQAEINKLRRQREDKLDFSPSNSLSLIMAENFDADKLLVEDMELSKHIRLKTIELKIAQARYDYLFGDSEQEDASINEPIENQE